MGASSRIESVNISAFVKSTGCGWPLPRAFDRARKVARFREGDAAHLAFGPTMRGWCTEPAKRTVKIVAEQR